MFQLFMLWPDKESLGPETHLTNGSMSSQFKSCENASCRQASTMRGTSGNKIIDHSDVVDGAAPTTSSLST